MYNLCIAHQKLHRLLNKWEITNWTYHAGISECRWTGSGRMYTKNKTGESYTLIYQDNMVHIIGCSINYEQTVCQHTNGVRSNQ